MGHFEGNDSVADSDETTRGARRPYPPDERLHVDLARALGFAHHREPRTLRKLCGDLSSIGTDQWSEDGVG